MVHAPFSPEVLQVFAHGNLAATAIGSREFGSGEMLVGLVQTGNWAADLPALDADALITRLTARSTAEARDPTESIPFSDEAKRVLAQAFAEQLGADRVQSMGVGGAKVEPASLLLAILHDRTNVASTLLMELGVDLDEVERALRHGPASPG